MDEEHKTKEIGELRPKTDSGEERACMFGRCDR